MGAIKPRRSPRPENLSDHYERDRTYELHGFTGDPSAPFSFSSFSALLAYADGADGFSTRTAPAQPPRREVALGRQEPLDQRVGRRPEDRAALADEAVAEGREGVALADAGEAERGR